MGFKEGLEGHTVRIIPPRRNGMNIEEGMVERERDERRRWPARAQLGRVCDPGCGVTAR